MTTDFICREVLRLKKKYHETDLLRLCNAMGILILREPMGIFDGACKGFFLIQSRKKAIVINCDLPEAVQRIILAHELGHAVLHARKTGLNAFHDFCLFDPASIWEYEANIFAAEFLLEDGSVLEHINEDASFFEIAAMLNVPPELLDFKFKLMRERGYDLSESPLAANGDFLKNMNTGSADQY